MIRYRADATKWAVVAVECAQKGYPHEDAEGRKQFDHSHFDTEIEASKALLAEANTDVRVAVGVVVRRRDDLARAEAVLVEAALVADRVRADISRKAAP